MEPSHSLPQQPRTMFGAPIPEQVSNPVIQSNLVSRFQVPTSSRCDPYTTVNSSGVNPPVDSLYCNDSFRFVAQSSYPAQDYSSLPVSQLNGMSITAQQSSYMPGRGNYDSMFLPRPEFSKYSGDPLEYKSFIVY